MDRDDFEILLLLIAAALLVVSRRPRPGPPTMIRAFRPRNHPRRRGPAVA